MEVVSFTIDHDRLLRGIYVSRVDKVGDSCVTTFDIRITKPNTEPFLDVAGIHTIEHLLAVYLRTYAGDFAKELIYIGPMGCRTGMYMIVKGEKTPDDVLPHVKDAFRYILDFEGQVPATTSKECGNYREHSLENAKRDVRAFYDEILMNFKPENGVYPE